MASRCTRRLRCCNALCTHECHAIDKVCFKNRVKAALTLLLFFTCIVVLFVQLLQAFGRVFLYILFAVLLNVFRALTCSKKANFHRLKVREKAKRTTPATAWAAICSWYFESSVESRHESMATNEAAPASPKYHPCVLSAAQAGSEAGQHVQSRIAALLPASTMAAKRVNALWKTM